MATRRVVTVIGDGEGKCSSFANVLAKKIARVPELGQLPVYMRVMSLRLWGDYRVLRRLPIQSVEVDGDTREVRLFVNGLIRRNAIGKSPLTLQQLVVELRKVTEAADEFDIVFSDNAEFSRREYIARLRRSTLEPDQVDSDDLDSDVYGAVFDMPFKMLRPKYYRNLFELRVHGT